MIFQKLGFLSLALSASGVLARSLLFTGSNEVFDIESPHAGDCCDSVQGVIPNSRAIYK